MTSYVSENFYVAREINGTALAAGETREEALEALYLLVETQARADRWARFEESLDRANEQYAETLKKLAEGA